MGNNSEWNLVSSFSISDASNFCKGGMCFLCLFGNRDLNPCLSVKGNQQIDIFLKYLNFKFPCLLIFLKTYLRYGRTFFKSYLNKKSLSRFTRVFLFMTILHLLIVIILSIKWFSEIIPEILYDLSLIKDLSARGLPWSLSSASVSVR